MVQLAERMASQMNRTYDVLYIDFEAQYTHTIAHIKELKHHERIGTLYHMLRCATRCPCLQPKWICRDETVKELWVRPQLKDTITADNCPWPRYQRDEEFIIEFADWYHETHTGKVACGAGIRADESPNRFQTIAFYERKEEYDGVYNFYPIYDRRVEDIWGAVGQPDLMNNEIYELMYKNGLSIYQQRLCQPYGDNHRNGPDQFKALGNIKSFKPEGMDWEQYTVFLIPDGEHRTVQPRADAALLR